MVGLTCATIILMYATVDLRKPTIMLTYASIDLRKSTIVSTYAISALMYAITILISATVD